MNRKKFTDRLFGILARASAAVTFTALASIVVYILANGIPNLTPSLFSIKYTSENVSLFPSLVTTAIMIVISLAASVPLGVFAAVYLVEYAGGGDKLTKIVGLTAETLSGIPSVVYGLFGMIFFVTRLGWGFSVVAGSVKKSMMILPLIMRAAEESIRSVPPEYREGSFGLGAGRLRTVFRVILPSSAPGILAGVILAIGRVAGETAALIYTSGTVPRIPSGAFSSARTLAVHMYALSSEGFHTGQAYATAVVLLVLVFGVNALSALAAKKLTKVS